MQFDPLMVEEKEDGNHLYLDFKVYGRSNINKVDKPYLLKAAKSLELYNIKT